MEKKLLNPEKASGSFLNKRTKNFGSSQALAPARKPSWTATASRHLHEPGFDNPQRK